MSRWSPTQSAMWSNGIVVLNPTSGIHLGFIHIVKQFPHSEIHPHMGIEAFAASILKRTSRFNICRKNPDTGKPFPKFVRGEFAAIIASQILRAPLHEH